MSIAQLDQATFCTNNRISEQDWKNANFSWDDLRTIGLKHQDRTAELEQCAELVASNLRRCEAVHSVRWRVKKTESVMAKVIRKRLEGKEKYNAISPENYHELLTDLVGVRALHLYKDNCFVIDSHVRERFPFHEPPVAYVRAGDDRKTNDLYTSAGLKVEVHKDGYRSVHYILKSQSFIRPVLMEVQVRTVFEEAWSEIDHQVRYPNFTDNKLVEFFLGIFNRMAGSSDEMATFVRDLVSDISMRTEQLSDSERSYNEQLAAMEKTIASLTAENADVKAKATLLQKQLSKLKPPTTVTDNSSKPTHRERSLSDSSLLYRAASSLLSSQFPTLLAATSGLGAVAALLHTKSTISPLANDWVAKLYPSPRLSDGETTNGPGSPSTGQSPPAVQEPSTEQNTSSEDGPPATPPASPE